jgi:hypothetical protein
MIVLMCPAGEKLQAIRKSDPFMIRGILMRTGQRDVHNTPKRRLSISYEELETLKKSIKVSVINELRAEMEGISDQGSLKDTVLSEIRTELLGIPNPALLKASILNELRTELKAPRGNDLEVADRRLREIAGVQDGLLRELLDQKTVIKKLENEVENLTKKLEDMKKAAQAPAPSFSFIPHEDPLDLPPLSKKPKHTPEFRKETPAAYEMIEFREAPAPLPGTSAKIQLKFREIEPRELDEAETEAKCEYIIAESGDKRRFRGSMTQQPSMRAESVRQSPPRQPALRQPAPAKVDSVRSKPADNYVRSMPADNSVRSKPADDYKCEYIIAEKVSKKHIIEESVDLREHEDAEIITCSRKSSRAY